MYDLIIIGAGPAGITASVYAARKKLNFLVISKNLGGQTLLSTDVENFIGYHYITGAELIKKFEEHMKDYDIQLKLNEEVKSVKKIGENFEVVTDAGSYKSKLLIVASGKEPRRLKIPGERKFLGRGVTYCAVCDAPLFKNKDVAVIGGGNAALDATLQLIKIPARKIYLININPELGGDAIMRDKVERSKRVEILNNSKTLEILGDKIVTGIKVEKDGKISKLDVQGVFVEIGSIPSTDFIKHLVKLNEKGEVIIDKQNMTSIPGIFAAGDVTDIIEKQIIVAAGEGAKALLTASEYLSKIK